MKVFVIIILVALIINAEGITQINSSFINHEFDSINYVENASFELYIDCPESIDELNKCKNWKRAPRLNDSPEYFHRCASLFNAFREVTVGVPENVFGYQEPRTGNAYVGISTFEKSHYQEYIQTQLKQPLLKGVTYTVGMHVSLADKSKYANDRFMFCFTDHARIEIRSKTYEGAINRYLMCPNGILYLSDTLITDTTKWVNIEVEYIAKGGEEFLTIGVFDGNISRWERFKKRRRVFNENYDNSRYKVRRAYYYIDDVYLIRKEDYLNTMQNDENE